ncbi:polysaccharide deacetylase family protein [Haladaptatus sp. NG-SE-30]
MRRQTRRMFLTTVGAAGTASLAGCSSVFGDEADTGNDGTTSTTSSEGTTSTGGGDTTTSGNNNSGSGPQTFESFEKLGQWHAVERQGTLKKSSKQKYEGSQSAHIVGSKKTKEGKIFRANFGGSPANLKGKNLSLAFKCTSHSHTKVSVQLYAPDRGHIVEMKRTLYGPKGKWVRINLGVTSDQRQKTIDLSTVYEIRITGRPVDTNSTKPIEFHVDDLKTVPTPEKGMVMLTFDDGLKSHYTKAYKKMKKYGFPGVDAIITDAVYQDDFLTQTQMREMTRNGWDMIAHPNTQAMPMNERSPKKQEKLMKKSKDWLKKYGYEGHKYMAIPKNVVGPNTFDLAQKHFDLTMSFGASPNALPAIQKDTILSRMYGDSSVATTKQMIDYAERYKQLTIPLFHKIGGDGMPEKDFEKVLQYIKKKNVEVVTPSQLDKKGLLI